jgi:hypothetical protein
MIDYDQTLASLRKAAEEAKLANNGVDYKYAIPADTPIDNKKALSLHCVYVHGTVEEPRTGCIVGKVLHDDFNVPFEFLIEFDDERAQTNARFLLPEVREWVEFTDAANLLLQEVQRKQDAGHGWSAAVEDAHLAVTS